MEIRRRIKVLVVDDSAFMRRIIKEMLEGDPEIQVIGVARDGLEAIEKIESLDPDVVTLDIEMPRMDGLEALRIIMERHPVPVLMVSSLTEEDARATFEALELGALDYIPKQLNDLPFNIIRIRTELIAKVKAISRSTPIRQSLSLRSTPPSNAIIAPSRGRERGRIGSPWWQLGLLLEGLRRSKTSCSGCQGTFPQVSWWYNTCPRTSPRPMQSD